jgi:hypothetical protein
LYRTRRKQSYTNTRQFSADISIGRVVHYNQDNCQLEDSLDNKDYNTLLNEVYKYTMLKHL